MDEQSAYETHSPAHVAALLRTLVGQFQQDPSTGPVFIGAGGTPDAVLLPFATFQSLLQHAEDLDIQRTVIERLPDAPAPGEGMDNDALAHFVGIDVPDPAARAHRDTDTSPQDD